MEDFFDVINKVHCKEKGHVGSKKTITEVRYNKATKVSKIKIVGLAIYRSARSMSTCIPRCAIDKFVEL